ncbi:cell division protein ZapA [Hymenobacter sp. DG25B]|jgi:cell division protein ZapA|uniref:cell division protein ZapA n=1 Tax=unclassified Hymenobacter TaxID=2615202 RepID=UPI0005409F80|nr:MULTISPECIES: cell division protein ZapA [unclassified Hymenobacter]AIZ63212.1 cell division protein ZapA [Hymenobacter sp. DG25B]ALD21666.1 cell division protein ZapA [Hymenobacter sp. DG25A]
MSDLSIKIRVADRDYPMRVTPTEEERLRMAGRLLNDRIREFREQYGIQDKQDLLAMIALSTMADRLKVSKEKDGTDAALTERLSRLDQLLSSLVLD